jgi:hypothetical protein
MLQYASFFRASGENTVNRHITVGLAMVASAALGAAAVQTLHAQTKPPAYNIAEITIKDQDGYNVSRDRHYCLSRHRRRTRARAGNGASTSWAARSTSASNRSFPSR